MSLQVWLPLTGHLNNQGLSDISVTNKSATVDTAGKLGKCYTFNGSSNYLSTTSYTNFGNNFTFSIWFKPTKVTGYQSLCCSRSVAYGGFTAFLSGSTLIIDPCAASYSADTRWSTSLTVTADTWYHLVITRSATSIAYYVNGVFGQSKNVTYADNYGNCLSFGAFQTNGASYANYFQGSFNDIRIYDHVLSPKEIKLLSQGLVCHYQLDENIGENNNIMYDSSGYNYHGTLSAPISYSTTSPRNTTSSYFNGSTQISRESISSQVQTIAFWLNTPKTASTVAFADYKSKIAFGFDANKYIITGCAGRSTYMHDSSSLSANTWQHIAIVKTSTTNTDQLYINGVLQALKSSTNNWTHQNDVLTITGRDYSNSNKMSCYISDFRMYTTALSQSDILELYNTPESISNNGILMTQGEFTEGTPLELKSASGDVITINDGAVNFPMLEVKSTITAVQAGSGDPSPSNVRAISGFAECDVVHTKKNLFDKDSTPYVAGKYISGGSVGGTPTYQNNQNYSIFSVLINPNTTYTFGLIKANDPRWCTIDEDGNITRIATNQGGSEGTSVTFTSQANDRYLLMSVAVSGTYKCDDILQVEVGSTATTYEPYAGETIPVWMGGKNLFINPVITQTAQTVVFTVNSDKSVTCNGTASAQVTLYLYGAGATYVDIGLPAGYYKISGGTSDVRFVFVRMRNGQITTYINTGGDTNLAIEMGDTFRVFLRISNGVQVNNVTVYPMIRLATESDDTYEPVHYIYGGGLNLTTGVLTITHKAVNYKNKELKWSSNVVSTDGYIRFNTSISDKANGYNLLCDSFPVSDTLIPSSPTEEGISGYSNNYIYISISASRLSGDLSTSEGRRDAFNAWIDANQLNVVYELATPEEIQLTPEEINTWAKTNNLFTNTGTSSIIYHSRIDTSSKELIATLPIDCLNKTVSGVVCSFDDGADDIPMHEVKSSIVATQSGTGDPSPSNVRAISGFAECDVTHTKKNLFYTDSSLFPMSENGIACPAVSSGNKNTILWDGRLSLGKWTIKENAPNASNSTHLLVLSKNGTTMRYITTDAYTFIVDNEEDSYRVRLYVYANNMETYVKPQLEKGDTATTYEPYYGATTPIWMGGKNLFPYISTFPYSGSMSAYFKEFTANGTNQKLPVIHLKEGVTYTLSADVTSTVQPFKFSVGAGAGTYSTDIETASNLTNGRVSVTFTPTASNLSRGDLLAFRLPRYSSSTSADITITNVQLELGDTATTYEPVRYIYGGELNLTTGVLTVTHERVDMGSLSWTKSASYPVFFCSLGGMNTECNACCDIYLYAGTTTSAAGANGKGNYTLSILTNDDRHRIYIRDDNYSTADDFTEAVDGHYLVYELTTPTTVQLTPEEISSYLGYNSLWTNTGNSFVNYISTTGDTYRDYNPKGEISLTANNTRLVSETIQISPTNKTYYYDMILSINAGDNVYIGLKTQNTSIPLYNDTPNSDIVYERYSGTIDLSSATEISLQIINGDSNTVSRVTGNLTVHYISLREVDTTTGFTQTRFFKTGMVECDTLLDKNDKMSIEKLGIINGTDLREY